MSLALIQYMISYIYTLYCVYYLYIYTYCYTNILTEMPKRQNTEPEVLQFFIAELRFTIFSVVSLGLGAFPMRSVWIGVVWSPRKGGMTKAVCSSWASELVGTGKGWSMERQRIRIRPTIFAVLGRSIPVCWSWAANVPCIGTV